MRAPLRSQWRQRVDELMALGQSQDRAILNAASEQAERDEQQAQQAAQQEAG